LEEEMGVGSAINKMRIVRLAEMTRSPESVKAGIGQIVHNSPHKRLKKMNSIWDKIPLVAQP
jgi:hypothetical protein